MASLLDTLHGDPSPTRDAHAVTDIFCHPWILTLVAPGKGDSYREDALSIVNLASDLDTIFRRVAVDWRLQPDDMRAGAKKYGFKFDGVHMKLRKTESDPLKVDRGIPGKGGDGDDGDDGDEDDDRDALNGMSVSLVACPGLIRFGEGESEGKDYRKGMVVAKAEVFVEEDLADRATI